MTRPTNETRRVMTSGIVNALMCLIVMSGISGTSANAFGGVIRATLDANEPIKRVWAIQRRVGTLTTSKGKKHDIGIYANVHEGKVVGRKIVIDNLPVPGLYDLKIETGRGGIIVGWDSNVPESDYVKEQPLSKEAKQNILKKLGAEDFSAFPDRMWVLDIQGNIQNAAVLVMKLRMRPFAGVAYKPGQWIWRVDRWQWEDPDEHTWVPYQERPFYALVRERLFERQLRAKRICFARHLGGIRLREKRPIVDLGVVKIPRLFPGVFAVNADGSLIRPTVLKGPTKPDWPIWPKPTTRATKQAGDMK